MDESRCLMKRSKSLGMFRLYDECPFPMTSQGVGPSHNLCEVSKSADRLSAGTVSKQTSEASSKIQPEANKLNVTFSITSLSESNNVLSPRREPLSKRRVLNEEAVAARNVRTEQDRSSSNDRDDKAEKMGRLTSKENDPSELPDPHTNISPDEFVLQLVKAHLGVDLQVKPAHSLDSFFTEVTEEQMASYTSEVVGCVRNNDLEKLKKLQEDGQPMDCFNRFGESLLNMACRRGFESIVQFLMERENVDVRICDDCGRTPLHDTCWNPTPQLNICKSIIEREPALLLISDRRGCTAFQYARKEHWPEWRKFLYDNRDCLTKLVEPDIFPRFAKCLR